MTFEVDSFMMGTVKSAGAASDQKNGLLQISVEIPDNLHYSGINIVKSENQNRSDGGTQQFLLAQVNLGLPNGRVCPPFIQYIGGI